MEADRIATIEDWPTPKSVKDVQVLMGFTNFYRRFVKKYAKVTAPISDLLKKPKQAFGKVGVDPTRGDSSAEA
jgi:DNA/RNA-binding domain of Phe-tRNA-synthetase-like protein